MAHWLNHFSIDENGNPIITSMETNNPKLETTLIQLPQNMSQEQWQEYWQTVQEMAAAQLAEMEQDNTEEDN